MIGYRRFNIAFDDSFAQMNRALRPAFLPLVVLANIYQVKSIARFLLVANIFGSILANPALGIVDYLQKSWRMIHRVLLVCWLIIASRFRGRKLVALPRAMPSN